MPFLCLLPGNCSDAPRCRSHRPLPAHLAAQVAGGPVPPAPASWQAAGAAALRHLLLLQLASRAAAVLHSVTVRAGIMRTSLCTLLAWGRRSPQQGRQSMQGASGPPACPLAVFTAGAGATSMPTMRPHAMTLTSASTWET